MNNWIKLGAVISIAPFVMGWNSRDQWDNLDGEWAYQTIENCDGGHSLEFTNDYPRDRYGNIEFPMIGSTSPPRRHRLATVQSNGEAGYRVNVHHRIRSVGDGTRIRVAVKHADVLPFNDFGYVIFEITDDNNLQEVETATYGDRLMRAIGDAPVHLVRCPVKGD